MTIDVMYPPAVPDSPVAIRGYRLWGLVGDGPWLQSTAAGFVAGMPVWEPEERFEATCLGLTPCAAGAAPQLDHNCGVHAFRHIDDAVAWARAMARHRPVVLGEVWCWGRVVESQRGWRAQYAYPASFLEVVASRRAARRIGPNVVQRLRRSYRPRLS